MKRIPNVTSISVLLTDGSNNAFYTNSEDLTFIEKSLNGSKKFMKLEKSILSDHLALRFRNNDFLYGAVNRIVTQLLESGITDWIVKKESSITYQEPSKDPVVITMDHLGIWFYLLAFLMVIAVVVFAFELAAGQVMKSLDAKANKRKKIRKTGRRSKPRTKASKLVIMT
jgi:hypothetical protein